MAPDTFVSDIEVEIDSEDSENEVPDDNDEFVNEIGETNLRRSTRICE